MASVLHWSNGYAQTDLNYFAGSWQFDTRFAGNEAGKPDISAQWMVEKGLDSVFCLMGHVELNGETFTRELISYNAGTKQYTRSVATNTGSWLVFTSAGWEGDTLVWTGSQSSQTGMIALREEIIRESPVAFTARFFSFQNGEWILLQTETLKRIKRQHHE